MSRRSLARRLRPRVLVTAAVATAVAAGTGLGASRDAGRASTDEPASARTATTPALALTVPAGWGPVVERPELAGLELEDAVHLAPWSEGGLRSEDVGLVAGIAARVDPRLLPLGLGRRMAARARPRAVQLGRLGAVRAARLPLGGRRTLTLYAVPTTRGTATVACFAPRALAARHLPVCEAAATTLVLRGREALPPGPSAPYARVLNGALRRLNGQHARLRGELARSRTRRGQAMRARSLARVHGAAATALLAAPSHPATAATHADLVRALRTVRSGYRWLAGSAARGDATAFRAAKRAVARREAAVRRAIAGLRAAGYEVA
jgi:hypothetical protein